MRVRVTCKRHKVRWKRRAVRSVSGAATWHLYNEKRPEQSSTSNLGLPVVSISANVHEPSQAPDKSSQRGNIIIRQEHCPLRPTCPADQRASASVPGARTGSYIRGDTESAGCRGCAGACPSPEHHSQHRSLFGLARSSQQAETSAVCKRNNRDKHLTLSLACKHERGSQRVHPNLLSVIVDGLVEFVLAVKHRVYLS